VAAFSFFAPAFLFLLPSLRKKQGFFIKSPKNRWGLSFFSLTHPASDRGALISHKKPAITAPF